MSIAYLALGSNIGDRMNYIHQALKELKVHGIEIQKTSSIIETDPVGGPAQGKYLNGVVKVLTSLSPEDLLLTIHRIEQRIGRIRKEINGPRIIDIDILLYEDIKLISRRLTIPHPRMLERDFVVKPLKEIQPDVYVLGGHV
jgi:2-amino-4-hydroxy-6-hydroxymethyldihydropteridine diphosphokinase